MTRRKIGWALAAALSYVLVALPTEAHDPAPAAIKRPGVERVPTRVEPIPPPSLPVDYNQPTTHFEFVVRDKHGVWLQEIYDIGAIADEQNEVRLAVVRAYEPGKPNAHITEATALRIDVRARSKHGAEARGWLDSYEVSQLVAALPGLGETQVPPPVPGSNGPREIHVAYPRGSVAFGVNLASGNPGDKRLFVRVGRGGQMTARFKADRFAELQALVKSADQVIRDVQDKFGHHQGSGR